MAMPMDRLGSVIVDLFIVLTPAVTLFSAPLQRLVLESFLLGFSEMIWLSRAGQWLMGVAILVVYQTIFWRVFGATLGQMFFGLRVVDLHSGARLSGPAALLRSLIWNAQWIFFLGLTFLTVFSHQFRRSWHDRLADSQVLTLRQRAAAKPSQRDALVIQGFLAGLAYLLAVIVVYQLLAAAHSFRHGVSGGNSGVSRKDCEAVDRAVADWPESTRRLEVAMALFAAGSIESECLEPELELARFERRFEGLDYLALAFLHADSQRRSDAYLKAVCSQDPDSFACSQAQIIRKLATTQPLSEERPYSKDSKPPSLRSADSSAPAYYRLWALRQAMKEEDPKRALELIGSLESKASLRTFLSVEQVKAWWALGQRERARGRAEILAPVMSSVDGLDMASFICGEDIEFSCQRRDSSLCQWSFDWVSRQSTAAQLPFIDRLALLWVRDSDCRAQLGQGEPEWMSLSQQESLLPEEAKTLLRLSRYQAEGNELKAQIILQELVEGEDFGLDYRLRAFKGKVQGSRSTMDMAQTIEFWRKLQLGHQSHYLGQVLFEQAIELGDYSLASEIGESLEQRLVEERDFQRSMVVVSWHQGQKKVARQWLDRWQHQGSSEAVAPSRLPASDSPKSQNFEKSWRAVLRQLGAR